MIIERTYIQIICTFSPSIKHNMSSISLTLSRRVFVLKLPSKQANISSQSSSNSEVHASELPDNCEEMFPLYYLHGDDFSTTVCC